MWLASFLQRRKQIDYDVFECQAENSNKTYELVTSMQEIKLQGCQQRRRWEWEDVQDARGWQHIHKRGEEHSDNDSGSHGGNKR